jgi:hypothetical protein
MPLLSLLGLAWESPEGVTKNIKIPWRLPVTERLLMKHYFIPTLMASAITLASVPNRTVRICRVCFNVNIRRSYYALSVRFLPIIRTRMKAAILAITTAIKPPADAIPTSNCKSAWV